MPRKPREIEKLLKGKFAFTRAAHRANDHSWYELQLPGLPVIATKLSWKRDGISSNLEAKMARQLRVRGPYFQGMMDCSNSREDYYIRVREDPYPPFDVRF